MHLALPFWPPLTSWGISTIMIIGRLAISANKRNTSKDKRTVPLSSQVAKSISSSGQNLYMGGINVSNHFNKIWEKGTWIKHLICYSFVLLIVFSFVFLQQYGYFL